MTGRTRNKAINIVGLPAITCPPKLLCSKPFDLVRYSERERGGSTSQSYAYLFVRSVTNIFNRGLCSRLELSLNGEYCVSPGISDTTPGGKEELLSIDGGKKELSYSAWPTRP